MAQAVQLKVNTAARFWMGSTAALTQRAVISGSVLYNIETKKLYIDAPTSNGEIERSLINPDPDELPDYSATTQLIENGTNAVQSGTLWKKFNTKQDRITQDNPLSYNLLSDTPDIPQVDHELAAGKSGVPLTSIVYAALANKQNRIDAQHKLPYYLISDPPEIPEFPAVPEVSDVLSEDGTNAVTAAALWRKFNTKQDLINQEHKLDYSLLANTPEVRAVANAITENGDGVVPASVIYAALMAKQNKITAENKLSYSLLKDVPEIPVVPTVETIIAGLHFPLTITIPSIADGTQVKLVLEVYRQPNNESYEWVRVYDSTEDTSERLFYFNGSNFVLPTNGYIPSSSACNVALLNVDDVIQVGEEYRYTWIADGDASTALEWCGGIFPNANSTNQKPIMNRVANLETAFNEYRQAMHVDGIEILSEQEYNDRAQANPSGLADNVLYLIPEA